MKAIENHARSYIATILSPSGPVAALLAADPGVRVTVLIEDGNDDDVAHAELNDGLLSYKVGEQEVMGQPPPAPVMAPPEPPPPPVTAALPEAATLLQSSIPRAEVTAEQPPVEPTPLLIEEQDKTSMEDLTLTEENEIGGEEDKLE